MNIFKYQGQEEDHYTHVLMSILSFNNCYIVEAFLRNLIPQEANKFNYKNISIHERKKDCPQETREYEYIIGIAPYENGLGSTELETKLDSIPDSWICGENFNLLFEFKIRGTLDEGQISAHKRLLKNKDVEVIRLNWDNVMNSLSEIKSNNEIISYLIQNFILLKDNFISKRQSSGMPKEIISGKKRNSELYFRITGSRNNKPYRVEMISAENVELLNDNLAGIQASRRFIAQYVAQNVDSLPCEFLGESTLINDYCVVPGRAENGNVWNQWRLGSYLNKLNV